MKILAICTIALFTISCACSEKKDVKSNAETELTQKVTANIVGGYSEKREVTKEDIIIFDEALSSFETDNKYKPKTVSTQVVSGTNYLFICDVVLPDGTMSTSEVLIFKPLPHTKKSAEVVKTKTICSL